MWNAQQGKDCGWGGKGMVLHCEQWQCTPPLQMMGHRKKKETQGDASHRVGGGGGGIQGLSHTLSGMQATNTFYLHTMTRRTGLP